ncbi:hypothetical protein CFD26_101145 [Aspergillus turcosus]|uniref:Uncharacterized protein n=1 Tax=Aspergillus turcosus TaxID=1245748 RepID=A0A3R7F0N1_9EURO|nr:hypothetical protein CFD26_101145 [Aspergillus turcosus]
MADTQIPMLNVQLLSKIKSFEKHLWTIWDLRSILIIFYVKYVDGSEGRVCGGPDIPGEPSSEMDLQELYDKVEATKKLVQEEDWIKMC